MNLFCSSKAGLIVMCAWSPLLAWSQTLPSEPARLPILEVRHVKATIVGLTGEVACDANQKQDTIELRDLRFSQVQGRDLRQRDISPQSQLHEQLMQAVRQYLQVPASHILTEGLTLCQLQKLSAELSSVYRNLTGLAAAIFVIDPQEVVNGVLHMQVLEAELEALELTDDSVDLDRVAVQEAMQVQLLGLQGRALRQDELERVMAMLQYITGRDYRAFLNPGDQPLGVKVRLQAQPRQRFQGLLRADNQGAASTGKNQASTVLQWQPDMVQGDRLTASYISGQTHSALNAYSVSYDLPLGLQGWRGGVRGGQTNYALGGSLASTQSTGLAQNVSAYLQYPLLRSLANTVDMTLGSSGLDLRDNTATTHNLRKHGLIWGEVRGNRQGQSVLQSWGLGLTAGRMHYNTQDQTTADASNLNLQGGYQLLSLDAKHSQALGVGLDLTASYKAQWSSKNLDTYHKMGVGGSQGVRAFAVGEATGDQAQLVRIEMGYSHAIFASTHRWSVFYDAAKVRTNHTPLAVNADTNRVRLSGAGLQWEMSLTQGLSTRVYGARAVDVGREVSSIDGKKHRFGADVTYRF